MLKKSTSAFTSLLLVLALNVSPSLFAQDEEAAPKISISFANEAETPAPVTPAPAPAAPATDAEVKKPVPQMTP